MKPFSKISLIFSISFILVACGGVDEKVYKSQVPVVKVPTLEERMAAAQVPQVPLVEEKEPEILQIPNQMNLDVPFFSQAPEGDWSMPWQEACEESSLLLAHAYATGQLMSKEEFKRQILAMVAWENQNLQSDQAGVEPYQHTTVEQTTQILEKFLGFRDYEILENPTVDQLKAVLAQGNVIVAPLAGRQLGNPFFSGEGPLYHMLVVRGYDESHFITNDVGTRHGENFIYSYSTLMNALHDWNVAGINQGAKKVIVLKKQS